MFFWENGETITKNKVSKGVNRVIFDANGDLITIGRGFFKHWKFKNDQIIRKKE
jgi:hypothetical protein